MAFTDTIGNRMKKCYEDVFKNCLVRRIPVAIRIDAHIGACHRETNYNQLVMCLTQEVLLSCSSRIR